MIPQNVEDVIGTFGNRKSTVNQAFVRKTLKY